MVGTLLCMVVVLRLVVERPREQHLFREQETFRNQSIAKLLFAGGVFSSL